ncbi:MAG TPA: tetratricopeptide repeat protein, partial [Candidatus Acidoferrales bacterium]|nr:tetratricopeptide repeat protein [Candidatus Acidoferrales bacterium]
QLYLNNGFNSKAIAIYKKISKLAPNETQPLEKLANLYVQQGILSEARPIFLQLAEAHLKANQTSKAVDVLRRLLEVEPDNPRVQRRLAELYLAMGQKKEAANTYLHFARYLHEHGDAGEAQKTIDAALAAEPGNSAALLLKARMLGVAGDADGALKTLASLPDADSNSEILGLQIDICLKSGKNERAVEIIEHTSLQGAEKYVLVLRVANALIAADDPDSALTLIDGIREPAIASGNQEHLAKVLTAIAEQQKGRIEPLEWLVDLYRRSGDNNLSEAQTHLADAYTNAGQSERAEATLNELLEREPDNELARQRLAQVRKKLGHASAAPADLEESFPQQPAPAPLLGIAAPVAVTAANDPGLDDDTQRFITQALTDVDLFSSYGLTQKAIQLLDNILQRVPGHAPTLERQLDLNLGAGDDRRTAELAAQLEQIYTQRGDAINAERFTELRRRFQRASGATDAEITAAQPVAQAPTKISSEAAAPAEFSVPVAPVETEVPSAQSTSHAGGESNPPQGEHEIDLSDEWASLTASEEREAAAESAPAPHAAEAVPTASAETADPEAAEFDLELIPSAPAAHNEATTTEGLLDQLVSEVEGLDASSGEKSTSADAPAKRASEPLPETEPVAAAADGKNELSEVFQEFRAELGEMGEKDEDEDLETLYNLGIAYREMGLLDEAIGEFQRVAKAIQEGRPFRYSMQCATLLGVIFMEKREPKIAALWYQRALELPALDPETILALRYDLGVAEEQGGNSGAALDSFRQVYAMNIDYRDVAERIAALQKH